MSQRRFGHLGRDLVDDGAAAGFATVMWGLGHAGGRSSRFPAWGATLGATGHRWLPTLTVAGLDVAPIIAAVVLVTGRAWLVARLADLEARWRVPVRPDNLPG